MRRLVGVLLTIISAAAFGAMPILARLAYASGTDPVTLLFLRFASAGVMMLVLSRARGSALPRGRTLLGLIGLGGALYVAQPLTYFIALTLIPASLVGLLFYIYPVLVTVLAALLFRERVTRAQSAALLLALCGAALVIGPEYGGHPLGILLAIGSAVLYSLYVIGTSVLMRRVSAIAGSAVIIGSAGIVFGALAALRGPHLPATPQGWAAALALAVVATVVAMVTLNAGLARIGAAQAATISTLGPVVTVALAISVLGEAITPQRIGGGALILGAVLILTARELRQARAGAYQ